MVLEESKKVNLKNLNCYTCEEYLLLLRRSLGKGQNKAEVNESRRLIHQLEVQLKKLQEKKLTA